MNHTTQRHVIDRIESLAAGASADVQVPPFTPERHRPAPPPPRSPRRGLLVAAAVTVTVAVSGAIWAARDDVRSVQTAASDPSEEIAAVVPTQWPARVDGSIHAHLESGARRPLEMDDRVASAVLELDGSTAATVVTVESSLRAMTATAPNDPIPDEVTGELDGRPTLWRNQSDGTLVGFIEVAESRTAMIASRTVDRSELEPLASAIAGADGDPSTATLPEPWTASASPSNLSDVLMFAAPGEEWSTVSGRSKDAAAEVSVSTMSTTDAETERERVREFAGPTAQRVDIAADSDGVLLAISGTNDLMHVVAWVPAPGLLSIAIGRGVNADEVTATARSANRATSSQWDALLPEVDRTSMHTVDGFDIPTTATVVDTGEAFGLRWIVIDDRPVIPDELKDDLAEVNGGLILRDADGRQGNLNWGDPSHVTGTSGQVGTHYVIATLLPKGTTDVRIERNDELLHHEHVTLTDTDRDLYFTIVPAMDVDPNLAGLITATLPDGRSHIAVR